jgi:polyisoprenoid-binding protein YceI
MYRKTIVPALLVLGLALILPSAAHAADVFTVDTAHSDVTFRIRHLISTVSGTFNEFDARIVMDLENLDASSVHFTIEADSIDTRNDKRDEHLRSEDFFDVETYPEITFDSSKIVRTGEGVFDVTGTLTMHGVSRQLTLPVTFQGTMASPWGDTRAGFSTSTTLNRKDFGISWNKTLDAGGMVLGETVDVEISLEAVLQQPESTE